MTESNNGPWTGHVRQTPMFRWVSSIKFTPTGESHGVGVHDTEAEAIARAARFAEKRNRQCVGGTCRHNCKALGRA